MLTLTPGMLRALTPSCPPEMRVRLAMFISVAAATLTLLHSGLPVVDTLTLLAVMTTVTILMTMAGGARRALMGLLRALVSAVDSTTSAGGSA